MSVIYGESATQGYLGFLNPVTGTTYDAVQTLVTNNASQDKFVTHIIVFNFHSAAVTVCIYYLPNNGGSVRTPASEDSYKIFELSVDANDTEVIDVALPLVATNDTVRVYASTTSVVNVLAIGYEVS